MPQLNGKSERLNRTLENMIRCMINDRNAPRYLWGEALRYAIYIRNRLRSKKGRKTRYEIYYNVKKQPKLRIHVFGSLVYFKKGLEEYGSSNMISTDITEYVDKHLSIFPNPVSNQLTIVSNQAINEVEIVDLTGKLIKTFKENTGILDVSDLTSGIYFIKLIADEKTITKKFVKK